jgi:hypothetical protein
MRALFGLTSYFAGPVSRLSSRLGVWMLPFQATHRSVLAKKINITCAAGSILFRRNEALRTLYEDLV